MMMKSVMSAKNLCLTVVVAMALVASLANGSPAAASLAKQNQRSLYKLAKIAAGNHANSIKRSYVNPMFDEMNRCILACAECSGDLNLPDDKDPEQTLSLVCANTCMETTDLNSIFKHLKSKHLFDATFGKCFVEYTLNLPEY